MLSSNDFRAGIVIEYRDSLWEIVEARHVNSVYDCAVGFRRPLLAGFGEIIGLPANAF